MSFDALQAAWILITFLLLFFWFPGRLFSQRANRGTSLGIAGNWTRMVLFTAAAIFILSKLRVLTALVVAFLLAIAFVIAWLHRLDWRFGAMNNSLQRAALQLVRNLETRSFGPGFLPPFSRDTSDPLEQGWRTNRWSIFLRERGIPIASILVVATIAAILRFANAWSELRLEQAEQYSYLLRARELILNLSPVGRPVVFPSLISTTSLISAVDPMQVTRFLSPFIGLLLVLALGLFLQACMRVSLASTGAMYCLGAAAFPPAAEQTLPPTSALQKLVGLFALSSPATTQGGTEFELGLIFVLLGLAFLAEWHWNPHHDSLWDVACCVVLAVLVSPFLLVLLAIAAVILLFRPTFAPAGFVLLCYGPAVYARLSTGAAITNDVFPTLPIAAAVAAGWLLAIIAITFRADLGLRTQPVLLAACLFVAIVWLRPHKLMSQPLEYDAAARQTQGIAQKFSAQKWVVAAPIEQFAETLGFGGYEDLAGFVQKYRAKASSPGFHFPGAAQDLFIYVETRPFQVFAQEPMVVPFAVLTDATYRSYRSPAGRASLESDALRLCESYRQSHSDMAVYFKDESLLIYRVHRDEVLKAATEEVSPE
jgi:hypothetical protein